MPDYKVNNKTGVPVNAPMIATASSVATGEIFATAEFPVGDWELQWTDAAAEQTFVSLVTLDRAGFTNAVTIPIEVV